MGTRIEWTEEEQDKLFTATIALLKDKPRLKVHDAVRSAQVVLPESRRRKHLAGISQLPAYLRDRFIVNGVLAKDWKKMGRGKQAPELVPIEEVDKLRAQLQTKEEEKQALVQQLASVNEEHGRALAHIRELESRPTFTEALSDFVAATLAEAGRRIRAVPGSTKDNQAMDVMQSFFSKPKPPPAEKPRHQPEPEPAKKVDPKNIVVVGVRNDEENRLTKHFDGRARIRFWKDNRTHTLEELVRHADLTVINRASTGTPIVDVCNRTGQRIQEVPTSGERMVDAIEHFIQHPDQYPGATQH